MNEYKSIILTVREGIAIVKMNRPEKLNAIDNQVLDELTDVFTWINEENDVKCAILTGEGKAFAAGADIEMMSHFTVRDGRDMNLKGQGVMNLIEGLDKFVIAAVNGFALGGGCELAMACDIRIASEKAKFGQPEVNLGIIPGYGGTQRLPRLVGKGMAKYLIATAEMIDAEEAYRIGLVQKVVSAQDLIPAAEGVAKKIMSKAPIAVKMAKRAINHGINMDLHNGVSYEAEAYVTAFVSEDKIEGVKAFLEKREAVFTNK